MITYTTEEETQDQGIWDMRILRIYEAAHTLEHRVEKETSW